MSLQHPRPRPGLPRPAQERPSRNSLSRAALPPRPSPLRVKIRCLAGEASWALRQEEAGRLVSRSCEVPLRSTGWTRGGRGGRPARTHAASAAAFAAAAIPPSSSQFLLFDLFLHPPPTTRIHPHIYRYPLGKLPHHPSLNVGEGGCIVRVAGPASAGPSPAAAFKTGASARSKRAPLGRLLLRQSKAGWRFFAQISCLPIWWTNCARRTACVRACVPVEKKGGSGQSLKEVKVSGAFSRVKGV